MVHENTQLNEVLEFWFGELSEKDWFTKSDEVDKKIVERFSELHKEVVAGEYWKYRTSGKSLLAEIIVLDQFSRNMFREDARAFAQDSLALALSQQAIANGFDVGMTIDERMFLYLPFMHSESKVIHTAAVPFFESLGVESTLKYEHIHKDIIDRFGRYPHRNEILGRESTDEEKEYLASTTENFF